MNESHILIMSVFVPGIGAFLDLWSERQGNVIYRRVALLQWFLVFTAIYAGVQIASRIPLVGEQLTFATGIIASSSTYAGMKLGLIAGTQLDRRARQRNSRAAYEKVLNG